MSFWWVSHNKTFNEEIGGSFIWSPKSKKNGGRNPFYDNMALVAAGDIIFSFAGSEIRAVGVATAPASTSPNPFDGKGLNWNEEGWFVPVNWGMLVHPIKPKEHMATLGKVLPDKYSPIRTGGKGNQGVYLAAVHLEFAHAIMNLLGSDFHNSLAIAGGNTSAAAETANEEQIALEKRTDIGATEIAQLVKARRGQGIFKARVGQLEKRCRVTGLDLPRHLIASHIKPWAASTDFEKLDGANGLLLSPHVDHLFDNGFISFEANGRIVLSRQLQYRVLSAWHIDPDTNVGGFTSEQQKYLEYHRDILLKLPA